MRRRDLIKAGGAFAGATLAAGCLERLGFETQSAWRDPPLVEDRPDAVYYPAIVEAAGLYGTPTAGPLGFAVMHSYPHRFFTLTGDRRSTVVVQPEDSLHLMATVWDRETGTVLPVDVSVEIGLGNGERRTTTLWPMLSPNMGFHYGDNVALPGPGTYDLSLAVGPLRTDRTEPFRGRFTERRETSLQFTFDPGETYDLAIERLGERAGSRGTVDLETMDGVPSPVVPRKTDLPGRVLHEGQSGDATVLVGLVEGSSRFRETAGPYLYVSPRTPYNRVMLPRMGLRTTVERDGETVARGGLRETLDPTLGLHYGLALDELESGDSVRVEVLTPPQLARHDGFETAFLDMAPIEFRVE